MEIKIYTKGSELKTSIEDCPATLNTSNLTVGSVMVGKGYNINCIGDVAFSSALNLTDFTLEFWAKFLDGSYNGSWISDTGYYQCLKTTDPYARNCLSFRLDSAYPSHVFLTPVANTLYHIAVTRNGSTMTTWVNGKAIETFDFSSKFACNRLCEEVTESNNVAQNYLRLTDQILYTSDFTPSFWGEKCLYRSNDEVWGYK